MGTGSFPGVKWPGLGDDHSPPPSAEVKEKVQPYIYSPFGPSWPVIGRRRGYLVKSTNIHLILQVFSAFCCFHLRPSIHRITYYQKFQCVLIACDETVALTATLSLDSYYRLI
jgi:hypothetical protein